MKNFELQVNGKTYKIKIIFVNREGYIYKVYNGGKYLFKDIGLVEENVKETISKSIKEHLTSEEIYNDFLKQIAELQN